MDMADLVELDTGVLELEPMEVTLDEIVNCFVRFGRVYRRENPRLKCADAIKAWVKERRNAGAVIDPTYEEGDAVNRLGLTDEFREELRLAWDQLVVTA